MLRAVLANAPNSIPHERVFSILNNTFDDDQDSSKADYIELALQLQFNKRSRSHDPVQDKTPMPPPASAKDV